MSRLTSEQVDAVLAEAAAEWRARTDELCRKAGLPTRPTDPYERRTAQQREDHARTAAEFYARIERNRREQAASLEALRAPVTRTPEESQALQVRLAEAMKRHGIETAD